jgi:hypothetical protein
MVQRYIPIFAWLPHYSIKDNLIKDIIGGLTLSALLIPQAMAYAGEFMLVVLPPDLLCVSSSSLRFCCLSLSLSALSLFPQFLRVSFPFVTFTRGKR